MILEVREMTDFGSDYVALIDCSCRVQGSGQRGTVVPGQLLTGVPEDTVLAMLRLGQACEVPLFDGEVIDKGPLVVDP